MQYVSRSSIRVRCSYAGRRDMRRRLHYARSALLGTHDDRAPARCGRWHRDASYRWSAVGGAVSRSARALHLHRTERMGYPSTAQHQRRALCRFPAAAGESPERRRSFVRKGNARRGDSTHSASHHRPFPRIPTRSSGATRPHRRWRACEAIRVSGEDQSR